MNNKDREVFTQLQKKRQKAKVPKMFIGSIVLLISGILFKIDEVDYKKHAIHTIAEVIDVTEYGYPVFSYEVQDVEYKVRSRQQISSAVVGSKVSITYHEDNPTYILMGENPLHSLSILMIVVGAIVGVISGYTIFTWIKKRL